MRGLRAAVLLCALATVGWGFSNVAPGEPLPEATMSTLDGQKQPWLGKGTVRVFFFFTPGKPNSVLALKAIAGLEQELAGKPVSFTGLVSSTVPAADAKRDVAEAKLAAPVLVDVGDAMYGKLGTALTPVVGVVDEKGKLLAYLPFHKLQYQDAIRAWIRFGLGELTAEQRDAALAPPAAVDGGELATAMRYAKMAEKQLKSGSVEHAVNSARKALQGAPDLVAAHAVLGAALAAQGNCAEALPELEGALKAEPANEVALGGRAACGKDGGK